MPRCTVVFPVIALVAALVGFTGIAAGAVEIAKNRRRFSAPNPATMERPGAPHAPG